MIDTTNKIFWINCGAEFALKLIGRKNCACVSCACLSMEEATPYFGAPTPFWSSHPHLEISRLQLYPSQVWRRVMRHTWSERSLITAAVICRVRLSSGDRSLPRACTLVSSWVQEGSVEGSSAAPEGRRRDVRRLTGQDAGPFNPSKSRGPKDDEAAAPRAPDLRGERVRPPDSAPYLDPSFQNTAPPSQPAQHDEDARSPVYFGHFIPFAFTFTFMHLADAFIQSDLHCIQVTVCTFDQLLLSLGIEPMILALLAPCSTIWATGKPFGHYFIISV